MKQILGEFIEHLPDQAESLELIFSFSTISLKQRWRNNNLVAHFLADYFSTFLSIEENQVIEAKHTVHYITNELLENAIKFNNHQQYQVRFNLHIIPEESRVILITSNSIERESLPRLENLFKEILSGDTHNMYINQIEASTQTDDISGLGLLTMINDYSTQLAWKIETLPSNSDLLVITTMAKIVINNV